ncbi:MAG: primosomal replication protein N, partial [Candidatus Competibacteraceae bacterium]|nr:primosomal replication protein N [Candidatus Competibacteraceae bacterium]
HHSQQVEAGHSRQVRARILVMAAGSLSRQAAALTPGVVVRVSGFISRANNRQGEHRLVLHALTIETVETTEE